MTPNGQRNLVGLKGRETTDTWRKLHNVKFYYLYSSLQEQVIKHIHGNKKQT